MNPLAPSYVEKEAAEPSYTLRMAEANKRRSHEEMALVRGMEFHPLAFSTYGIPGPETLNFLNKVARAHFSDKNGCIAHLLVAIQKKIIQIIPDCSGSLASQTLHRQIWKFRGRRPLPVSACPRRQQHAVTNTLRRRIVRQHGPPKRCKPGKGAGSLRGRSSEYWA